MNLIITGAVAAAGVVLIDRGASRVGNSGVQTGQQTAGFVPADQCVAV